MGFTVTNLRNKPEQCLHWIRWADADYLSARLLLQRSLVIQGSAFANTAIEKYLKCILHDCGIPIPIEHKITKVWRTVKANDTTNMALNEGFLQFLEKAYSLRYPDILKDGFNIGFNHAKILAELDRSVDEITKRFHMTKGRKRIAMILEEGKHSKNRLIVSRNLAINPSVPARLFRDLSWSYDIRVSKGHLYQFGYRTKKIKDDGAFDRRALVAVGKGKFKLAYAKHAMEASDSD